MGQSSNNRWVLWVVVGVAFLAYKGCTERARPVTSFKPSLQRQEKSANPIFQTQKTPVSASPHTTGQSGFWGWVGQKLLGLLWGLVYVTGAFSGLCALAALRSPQGSKDRKDSWIGAGSLGGVCLLCLCVAGALSGNAAADRTNPLQPAVFAPPEQVIQGTWVWTRDSQYSKSTDIWTFRPDGTGNMCHCESNIAYGLLNGLGGGQGGVDVVWSIDRGTLKVTVVGTASGTNEFSDQLVRGVKELYAIVSISDEQLVVKDIAGTQGVKTFRRPNG